MVSNKKNKTKRKLGNFNLKPIDLILGIVTILFTIYIAYKTPIGDNKLFSISILALIAGLLIESFRVSYSWKTVIYVFIGTYIGTYFMCLISFMGSEGEVIYDSQFFDFWLYSFLFFFSSISAIINKEKITAKLNEGVTLLLSISVIYWIFDYGFIINQNWLTITLTVIVLISSLFSILNAFTNIQLSKTIKIVLGIWSRIIIFAFAIDNISRVFSNQYIETSEYLSQGLYIGLQYFFLGISTIYIMQNFMLLFAFAPSRLDELLPSKYESYNMKDLIDSFSETQVYIGHSLFCILYSVIIYIINYYYQVLPRNTIIWLVLFTFPLILQLTELINKRKSYT